MINLRSLKFIIGKKTNEIAAELEYYDKLMISAITYVIYNNNLTNNNNLTTNMTDNVDGIVKNTYNDILDYKDRYASYYEVKSYILKLHKNNLQVLTDGEIFTIYNKSLDRVLQPEFSTVIFTTEMYNTTNLNYRFQERLARIHYKVMCPIIQYYHDRYNIPIKNMLIEDISSVPSNPGKVINFTINGIDLGTIVNDLQYDVFNLGKYVYKVSVENDMVKLIIR